MKFNIAHHDQSMKSVNFVPGFHKAFFWDELTHLNWEHSNFFIYGKSVYFTRIY